MTTTLSRGFRVPDDSDAPPDISVAVGNLGSDINSKVMKFLYGPQASLPTWVTASEGTCYVATDTGNIYFGTNTAWILIRSSRTLLQVVLAASANITTETETAPQTIFDFGAMTFNGTTKIKVDGLIGTAFASPSGGGIPPSPIFSLWDNVTDLGRIATVSYNPYIADYPVKIETEEFTPSSGSHQFKIRCWNNGGVGNYLIAGYASFPAGPGQYNRAFGRLVTV